MQGPVFHVKVHFSTLSLVCFLGCRLPCFARRALLLRISMARATRLFVRSSALVPRTARGSALLIILSFLTFRMLWETDYIKKTYVFLLSPCSHPHLYFSLKPDWSEKFPSKYQNWKFDGSFSPATMLIFQVLLSYFFQDFFLIAALRL